MKIIFSRKGFDSSAGGCASPIFPDGAMASFPIPLANSKHRMCDINCGEYKLGDVVRDLTWNRSNQRRLSGNSPIHLDPYLTWTKPSRPNGWLPAFGQDSAAQGHLRNEGVGVDDLFLFFGWFRRVKVLVGGQWEFVAGAPNLHVLFGWLQVGSVISVDAVEKHPPWLDDHPHVQQRCQFENKNNTIYVAAPHLILNGEDAGQSGGGAFQHFATARQLSHSDDERRSKWKLPHWFYPFGRPAKRPLSYHKNPDRWTSQGKTVALNTVGRGQEFVLNADQYPEALDWVKRLFSSTNA